MPGKNETAAALKQHCKKLEAALLNTRNGEGNNSSAVAEAYQLSRNVRDSANASGYPLLGMIATNLCRILEVVGKVQMDCAWAVLDCHFEAFRLAQTPAYERMKPAELPQLSMGLLQIVQIVKINAARGNAAPKPTR